MGMSPARVSSYAVLNSTEETQVTTHNLANATLALLDRTKLIEADSIDVRGDQLGDGYGIPTSTMLDAVRNDGADGRASARSGL